MIDILSFKIYIEHLRKRLKCTACTEKLFLIKCKLEMSKRNGLWIWNDYLLPSLMIPIVILFLFTQNQIMQGMVDGAIK